MSRPQRTPPSPPGGSSRREAPPLPPCRRGGQVEGPRSPARGPSAVRRPETWTPWVALSGAARRPRPAADRRGGAARGRGALADDADADHAGWFCVSTDPFPCPAAGCDFVAEYMTAAHLILVWEERDDPNLLRHAERAKQVGRNPRVVTYEPVVRAERLVLRLGGGRSAGARREIAWAGLILSLSSPVTWGAAEPGSLGVEEEILLVDEGDVRGRPRLLAHRRGADRRGEARAVRVLRRAGDARRRRRSARARRAATTSCVSWRRAPVRPESLCTRPARTRSRTARASRWCRWSATGG